MLALIIRESLRNLRAAKQRSLLALLGIVIGTGSVIAMSNIGAIAKKHALEQILASGIDIVVISVQGGRPGATVFDQHNVPKLVEEVPELNAAVPIIMGNQPIAHHDRPIYASVVAAHHHLLGLIGATIAEGRVLSRFDQLELFAVVGHSIVEQSAQEGQHPITLGDELQIGDETYWVVGVLDPIIQSPLLPMDINNSIFVTFNNAPRITNTPVIQHVIARVEDVVLVEQVQSSIRSFVQHYLEDLSVNVMTAIQMVRQMSQEMRTYSLLLGAIGGISLVVGGVGVMNVMLVSVTERRLEIGIRMAIGARRRDIKNMFLIESLVLSIIGGLVGTILGLSCSAIFAYMLEWQFVIAHYAIPVGVGVSTAVGVFFGWYPAACAARLNPVDALRAE